MGSDVLTYNGSSATWTNAPGPVPAAGVAGTSLASVTPDGTSFTWTTKQRAVAEALGWTIVTDAQWAGGADATGVADSTAAINAALAATPAGSRCWFPDGLYSTQGGHLIPDGVSIAGSHYRSVTVQLRAGSSASYMFAAAAYASGQTFSGYYLQSEMLSLDGNSANNSGSTCDGIVTMNSRVTHHKVFVYNFGGHGLRFRDKNSAGSNLTNTTNECRVEECTVFGNGGHGIFVDDANGKITDGFITNCVSYNNALSQIYGTRGAGWLISGNHVYCGGTLGQHGIYFSNCFATRVVSNYIDDYGRSSSSGYWSGIRVDIGSGRGTIVALNNITGLESNSSSTYRHLAVNIGSSVTAYAQVVGNLVNGVGASNGTGIYFSAGTGSTLYIQDSGNTIFSATTALVAGANVVLSAKPLSGTLTATNLPLVTTVGDLVVGTGASTAALLASGGASAAGKVLTVQSDGSLAYATPPGASGGAAIGSATPQSLGDAAVGSSSNASHEDHVHPGPSVWTPADQGLIGWAFDPALAGFNKSVTAGQLVLIALRFHQATTITNVLLGLSSAGAGLASTTLGIYQGGALLASTADASITLQTSGLRSVALTSPTSVSVGVVFVGLVIGSGTTMPSLFTAQTSSGATANAGFSAPGSNNPNGRFLTAGSGLTALPASLTTGGLTFANTVSIWAGAS